MLDLLWPEGPPPTIPASSWAEDLELDILLRALVIDNRYHRTVRDLLLALPTDTATIRYRQALLSELLAAPGLQDTLEALLPALDSLSTAGRNSSWSAETSLLSVARRLGELALYLSTVTTLRDALVNHPLQADGWLALHRELDTLANDPLFTRLAAELPALQRPLEQLASVTIGVNLDSNLRPTGATLVSVNDFRFNGEQDFISRLFGKRDNTGLTPLRPANPDAADPFSVQLLRDLERLVGNVAQEVADTIAPYSRLSGGTLASLRDPFAFYLGAARLAQRLHGMDLPFTFPTILPIGDQHTHLEALYDISLALQLIQREGKANLVLNDARLNEQARVAILTGPNRGGKTTFIRAVGLIHAMAQAGLPVPARRARLSPVDAIFTQFASGESHMVGYGRFDKEAHDLAAIFDRATPASLILLNEPLSGTNPEEALHLARGVVQGFQHLGARTILATHMHTLAREAPLFTDTAPTASPVMSLIASPFEPTQNGDGPQRTFRVLPGPPSGDSRALEIAREHGLSPEQVLSRIRKRGFVRET